MAVVIFLVFILLIPIIASIFALLSDCDILLKCCELFGARPVGKLRGKVVWVTGASSGIGEVLAYELARSGCRLVLSGTRKDKLEEVKEHCAEIAEKDFQVQPYDKEQNILVVPLDLSQYHTHQQCTEQVLTHFGKVDILVNNGGRTQSALAMDCQAIEIEEAVMSINTLGTISLTKTVLQSMIRNKQGHVVVISSLAGKIGVPEASSYCASKFALEGYFYALRTELFQHGINITTVCPGPVVSRILENAFAEDPKMVYGDRVKFQGPGKRMPTLRCVELILVGIANQLDEIWITPRPLLLFFYLGQYFPFLFQTIFKRIGLEQIRKMRARTNTVKKTT